MYRCLMSLKNSNKGYIQDHLEVTSFREKERNLTLEEPVELK